MARCIVFSAVGGTGKTTVIQNLQKRGLSLQFSISATTREPRNGETHGEEYYFLSVEEFENKIERNEFLEYEEVFDGCYYGTLKKEVDKGTPERPVVLDIDVLGAENVKQIYGDDALLLFLEAPSKAELRRRLEKRGDSKESINKKLERASLEKDKKEIFDHVIVNDELERCVDKVQELLDEN
mgnify:CR=1 FL=1